MWISLMGSKGNKVDENLDKERLNLGKHFDKIRFTHAFPSTQKNKRPVKPPLSLVKANETIYDVALFEGAGLINDNAPEFAIDWKDSSDVQQKFGWPKIKQELRVRTAVESNNRRSSEGQLFAYEMIVPKYKDGKEWIEFVWNASLDLKDVPEEKRYDTVKELQGLLSQGITGLGKTKTFTKIDLLENDVANVCESKLEPKENDLWIITLQTPALLCDPNKLESNSALKLKEAYNEVWQQLSGNTLELKHFFATQSLAGGFYLWKRFQQNQPYQPYQPCLLTDAGSVFVLKATGDVGKAQKTIKEWFEHGLPFPRWAMKKYQIGNKGILNKIFKHTEKDYDYWSICPYIRHNGYGEIAVNLDVHWKLRPEKK